MKHRGSEEREREEDAGKERRDQREKALGKKREGERIGLDEEKNKILSAILLDPRDCLF